MITNDRGDVVELLDANGNAFAAYRYDAWGLPQGSGNGISTTSTGLISSTLAGQIASRQVPALRRLCLRRREQPLLLLGALLRPRHQAVDHGRLSQG